MGRALEIELLQALIAQAHGKQADALITLERVLALAEPESYVRLFVDKGPAMAALLSEAHTQGFTPEYVARIRDAFPRTEGQGPRTESAESPHAVLSSQSSALVEPLSDREIEILHLIAAGLSNQGIADHLVIALSTVKKHINNIYGKLDAQSRTQALVRARQLHLL